MAHEKGDANRSARVEGPFWYIENNFLAGRQFDDWADLNREAREWCDKVNAKFRRSLHGQLPRALRRRARRARRCPLWCPEVYVLHQRIVDAEGYVNVDGTSLLGAVPAHRRPSRCARPRTMRVFLGPREVAVHDKAISTTNAADDDPRAPAAARAERRASAPLPEERELAGAGAPFAGYAIALKQRVGPLAARAAPARAGAATTRRAARRRDRDRRALRPLRPRRLERMVSEHVATEYFVVPAEREDPDRSRR